MPFEIQHLTLCDGWINTWTLNYPDGTVEPETFTTQATARAALIEFLEARETELSNNHLSDVYRISAVASPNNQTQPNQ